MTTQEIRPHPHLDFLSCDQIAECYTTSPELYTALWDVLTKHGRPLKSVIDIEESSPHDALGINTPKEFWNHFTPEQQVELNQIMSEGEEQ